MTLVSDQPAMRFLFGDRELLLVAGDLLSAPVEVIVNTANHDLSLEEGLASQLRQYAGNHLQTESEQLIREYGPIDTGMAVYTSAGELPYKAIIHAIGPQMGEGEEQRKLEQAISRSLQLCDMNEWRSIGFPALGTGKLEIPVAICAQAFYRAITRFWDARHDCAVEKVMVCLRPQRFRSFFDAFREHGIGSEEAEATPMQATDEDVIGEVELGEAEIAELDDADINKWFK